MKDLKNVFDIRPSKKNLWTIEKKKLKIVKYNNQPLSELFNGGAFFDTPEEAIHFKRYIAKSKYGKLGAKMVPTKLNEEEELKNKLSKYKNRFEHGAEMLSVILDENLLESSLWKTLQLLLEEDKNLDNEWIRTQIKIINSAVEHYREDTNYSETGTIFTSPLVYKRNYEDRNYLDFNSEDMISYIDNFNSERNKYLQEKESLNTSNKMIKVVNTYFDSNLPKLWLRQTWDNKVNMEKTQRLLNQTELENRFYSGCDVFDRIFLDEIDDSIIKYDNINNMYNIVFYTRRGITILDKIIETDIGRFLIDNKGRIHTNLSICFIDKTIKGKSLKLIDNSKKKYWRDNEIW